MQTYELVPELSAFGDGYAVIASGNTLYCIDADGIRWKKKFVTTFYRDPYTDVKISALDARGDIIAVGTNFMDGKLYLIESGGKKLWEHQFATIASLGWRPEDVTSVSVGKDYVSAATRFMHDYVYAYTFDRERLFEHRFDEDVLKVSSNDLTVVVTEKRAAVFDRNSKKLELNGKFTDGCECCGNVFLCGADNPNPNPDPDSSVYSSVFVLNCRKVYCCELCDGRNYVCLCDGRNLEVLSSDARIQKLWKLEVGNVVSVFCEDIAEFYVMTDEKLLKIREGVVREEVKIAGKPVGICDFGAFYFDGSLKVMSLP